MHRYIALVKLPARQCGGILGATYINVFHNRGINCFSSDKATVFLRWRLLLLFRLRFGPCLDSDRIGAPYPSLRFWRSSGRLLRRIREQCQQYQHGKCGNSTTGSRQRNSTTPKQASFKAFQQFFAVCHGFGIRARAFFIHVDRDR